MNSEEERSVRNRRCRTPGCIVVDCDCGMVLECSFVIRALSYAMYFFQLLEDSSDQRPEERNMLV